VWYYAASNDNPLPTFRDKVSVPSSRVEKSKKKINVGRHWRLGRKKRLSGKALRDDPCLRFNVAGSNVSENLVFKVKLHASSNSFR
jgi:hypothetical protein